MDDLSYLNINSDNRLIMDAMVRRTLGKSIAELCEMDEDDRRKLINQYYSTCDKRKNIGRCMIGSGDSVFSFMQKKVRE